MTAPIDPIRRTAASGPAKTTRRDAPDADPSARLLPVPVDPPIPAEHVDPPPPGGEAAFAAHLLGQDGQKRGLRGGPAVLDAAQSSYTRASWSGAADRRAPKGRAGKTEV